MISRLQTKSCNFFRKTLGCRRREVDEEAVFGRKRRWWFSLAPDRKRRVAMSNFMGVQHKERHKSEEVVSKDNWVFSSVKLLLPKRASSSTRGLPSLRLTTWTTTATATSSFMSVEDFRGSYRQTKQEIIMMIPDASSHLISFWKQRGSPVKRNKTWGRNGRLISHTWFVNQLMSRFSWNSH